MKTRKETIEICKAIRETLKQMTKVFSFANEEKFRQCVRLIDKWIENASGEDLSTAVGDDAEGFKDYLRRHIEMYETSAHSAQSMAHLCRSFLMILENAPEKIEAPAEEA
jgi:hypothetical protein